MKFTDNKDREIELAIDEFEPSIEAFHEGTLIGGFIFSLVEMPNYEYLLVTNMHLEKKPGYLRAGIGSKIIEVAQDTFGCDVVFSEDDSIDRENGSHLTGDGPAFAQSFQKNNAIEVEE